MKFPANFRGILRKTCATSVILFVVSVQIIRNLPFPVPEKINTQSEVSARLYWTLVAYPTWLLGYGASWVGIGTHWRMFAPPDANNWDFLYYGKSEVNKFEFLAQPLQKERNFWERNATDFREAKFQLNLFKFTKHQEFYAQHLCQKWREAGKKFTAISIYHRYRPIQKWRGNESPKQSISTFRAEYKCLPLLPPV